MPRKHNTITVRLFVPDGNGGYINHEDLTREQQKAFGKILVNRMGEALNYHFSAHPDSYKIACRSAV